MKKGYLKTDYIAYTAVKTTILLVSLLPISLSLWVGKIIGLCMYHFHPKRKRIAYANLKAAFSRDKKPSELKGILKMTYENYGQIIMEMMSIAKVDFDYLEDNIEVERIELIAEAQAKGKGVIFLTSHFGNWEFSSLKSGQIGYPIYVLARRQRFEKINELLNGYREKLGCRVISRGMASRELIRALHDNKIVGILADQDVGKSGVYADFFGRPASHATGVARLARDRGAAILPAFIVRERGPKHVIKLQDYYTVPKTDNRDEDMRKAIERQARILESCVTQYPDQWMWVYTRWKSTPTRRVLILSDGKRGHLNQSLAAFNVIKKCRRDAGFEDKDTPLDIIEVKFKNRLSRAALSLCSLSSTHMCQGCMKCLKFCLTKDSYNRLVHAYADIIISCGSS